MLPKVIAYVKWFDETKYMSFIYPFCGLLKQYDKIWEKISNIMQKGFGSQPVYNEKYLKTKIRFYNNKINTNFHDNDIPKEYSHYVCLSVILIDSVFKMSKNYHPQAFLEECKYVLKKNKMGKFINKELEIFSDESDEE